MLRSGKQLTLNITEKAKRGPYNKTRQTLIKEVYYNSRNLPTNEDVIGHYLCMRKEYPTSAISEWKIFDDIVCVIYENFNNLSLLAKITINNKAKSVVNYYKKLAKNIQSNDSILKEFIKQNFCITKELNNENHDMDTIEEDFILEEEDMGVQQEIVSLEEPEIMVIDNDQDVSINSRGEDFSWSSNFESNTANNDSSNDSDSGNISDSSNNSDSNEETENKKGLVSKRNYSKIEQLCIIGLRYDVGINKIALLGSATLVDNNVVTPTDRTRVIDPKKVSRTIEKLTAEADRNFKNNLPIVNGIYFDSKKQETQVGKENLYVILHGKKNEFLCYGSSSKDDAVGAFQLIKSSLENLDLNLEEIFLVGADGTNVNTGHKKGCIRLIEVNDNKFFNISNLTFPSNLLIRLKA